MELYKVTGTFELVVRAYNEEHVTDLIDSMISKNPETNEIFDLQIANIQAVPK